MSSRLHLLTCRLYNMLCTILTNVRLVEFGARSGDKGRGLLLDATPVNPAM